MFLEDSLPVFAANNPRNTYEVKLGDTLWKIASTYGTTANDLKLINGLQQPDVLLVGQRLRVPIMYSSLHSILRERIG